MAILPAVVAQHERAATEPIAWYSEITGRRGRPPFATSNSDAPGSASTPRGCATPVASRNVGAQSICETGASTTLPAAMSGPAMISGTPADSSYSVDLPHNPRAPRLSPWSLV
jgi:hypothetical protein